MSVPEFDTVLSQLLEAIAHRPLDAAHHAKIRSLAVRHGLRDARDLPRYLLDGLHALATRTPSPWRALPPEDRGHSWMLREFAEALPGGAFADGPDGTDYLLADGVGFALAVAARGADERWAVVPREIDAAMRGGATFARPDSLAQLMELAANADAWKRDLLARVVDRIVTLSRPDMLETMEHACDLARATEAPHLVSWADDLDEVLRHARGRGPIDVEHARALARILLIGRRRPSMVLDESRTASWWSFRARQPGRNGRALDLLYVHAATGALVAAPDPLSNEALEARLTTDRMSGYTGERPGSKRRAPP